MEPKTVGRADTSTMLEERATQYTSGLVAGTKILTGDGEIPVEFLTSGDRVISRAHGMVKLFDMKSQVINAHVVRITPGALGSGVPEAATMMPAAQRVLLRDWRARALFGAPQAVVPVGCLVDGDTICDLGERELRLFSLRFTRPEVIYADGIEVAMASAADALRAQAA